jgi:hypothetical protein
MEAQVNILTGGSKEAQESMLLMTLEQHEDMGSLMERMVTAWKRSDVKSLGKILRHPTDEFPELKPFYKELFDLRNAKMAQKIAAYLNTDKKYFVVVGSGHLVGKTGIPRLLRNKDYEVKRLKKPRKSKRKSKKKRETAAIPRSGRPTTPSLLLSDRDRIFSERTGFHVSTPSTLDVALDLDDLHGSRPSHGCRASAGGHLHFWRGQWRDR